MNKTDLATILDGTSLALADIDREGLEEKDDTLVLVTTGLLAVLARAIQNCPHGDELALLVWLALETDGVTDPRATLY